MAKKKSRKSKADEQRIADREARGVYVVAMLNQRRATKLEIMVLRSPSYSAMYAVNVLKRRWKTAEPIIARDALASYKYADLILKSAFPLAEKSIAEHGDLGYLYAKRILKGRFLLGEKNIAKDPVSASRYASSILKRRWKQAEKTIMKDTKAMLTYAKGAIRGPLPEPMHTAMVMLSFTDDPHAKKYGSTTKFMTPPAPKKAKKAKGGAD